MSEASHAPHFQYSSGPHQAETAIAGMWLFLATEVLFFGALFLSWIYARHWNPEGFDIGARQTSFAIGTVNTVLLITSSLVVSVGIAFIAAGNSRRLIRCYAFAWLLGAEFLVLKLGVEWHDDFAKHLFPGASFAIQGPLRGGAQSFFVFYFIGTAIHGLHMIVGLALVGWIILQTSRNAFSASYFTPVVIVGLYWSFVDIVWIILYPLIYLVGRGP